MHAGVLKDPEEDFVSRCFWEYFYFPKRWLLIDFVNLIGTVSMNKTGWIIGLLELTHPVCDSVSPPSNNTYPSVALEAASQLGAAVFCFDSDSLSHLIHCLIDSLPATPGIPEQSALTPSMSPNRAFWNTLFFLWAHQSWAMRSKKLNRACFIKGKKARHPVFVNIWQLSPELSGSSWGDLVFLRRRVDVFSDLLSSDWQKFPSGLQKHKTQTQKDALEKMRRIVKIWWMGLQMFPDHRQTRTRTTLGTNSGNVANHRTIQGLVVFGQKC